MTASTFDLPSEIIGLEDYTESINMLVYGGSGIGKTVLAGSARTLILATEHGTVSAARQGSKAKMWDAVGQWYQVEAWYEWVYDHCDKEGFPFDWIAIDTGTELQHMMLRTIVNLRVEAGAAKNLNPYKIDINEYGEMHEMFRDWVKKINDLPINTLWTAQTMSAEKPDGTEFLLPSFQGKGHHMASWVAAQMHCYGHMAMREVQNPKTHETMQVRSIQWQSSSDVQAKDRFDALPKFTNVIKGKDNLVLLQKRIEDTAAA